MFPPKACQAILCSNDLEAEWHIAWFAAAFTFSFYSRSLWCCHRHVVTCAGVQAHQMAAVTNPPPPHLHFLLHMIWHNHWLGGGPHACPRFILILMFHIHNHKGFVPSYCMEDCADMGLPLSSLHHPFSCNINQLIHLYFVTFAWLHGLTLDVVSAESFIVGRLKSKLVLSILRDFPELFFYENASLDWEWVFQGVLVMHSAHKLACYISSPCNSPNSIQQIKWKNDLHY